MSPTTDQYDAFYAELGDAFGARPDALLLDHRRRIDPARPVLDVGAGQGRHALLLAAEGCDVEAIDPSAVAIRAIEERAAAQGLSVRTAVAGFDTFQPTAAAYGAVLIFGLFPDLTRQGIADLLAQVRGWTSAGSLVYVTAFTTDDASYATYARGERVGLHSYVHPDHGLRTFLEPGELPSLMPGYEVLHHADEIGPEHRHGDGPLERHARATAVLSRAPEGTG